MVLAYELRRCRHVRSTQYVILGLSWKDAMRAADFQMIFRLRCRDTKSLGGLNAATERVTP